MPESLLRVLACGSRYSVQDDPKDAGKILLQPMPQDHDDKFWQEWYNKNPVPLDQLGRNGKGKAAAPKANGAILRAVHTNGYRNGWPSWPNVMDGRPTPSALKCSAT